MTIGRRKFIAVLGGMALGGPLAARAEQPPRGIGVLMSSGTPSDAVGQARLAAFLDGLQQLGWIDGRNVRIDTRWARDVGGDRGAEELAALDPEVILASGSLSVAALQRVTRRVPIVFANVIDPVGAGFVASLARPGGNTLHGA
jgi:putative tryptophan/tyrosine transport system substrate-binding protein